MYTKPIISFLCQSSRALTNVHKLRTTIYLLTLLINAFARRGCALQKMPVFARIKQYQCYLFYSNWWLPRSLVYTTTSWQFKISAEGNRPRNRTATGRRGTAIAGVVYTTTLNVLRMDKCTSTVKSRYVFFWAKQVQETIVDLHKTWLIVDFYFEYFCSY